MTKRPDHLSSGSRYALYSGCTVPVRALNYELSARKVAGKLGLEISDIAEFACCGYPIKSVNRRAYLLMAARNLALAEERRLPIVTLCSACCGSLSEANHELKEDEGLRNEINRDLSRWIGKRYEGGIEVFHFMRVLQREVGTEKIRKAVQADLSALRVAPHYGCHYTKPSAIYHRIEDPEDPKSLDELIEATGAHSVSYDDKLQCCGGGVLAMDEQVALAMSRKKLDHIHAAGADAMILVCPFCNVMYESNQKKIEKVFQTEYKLPILFYPQLLGLALGMDPDELGLKMNRIKANELLKKVQRRPA